MSKLVRAVVGVGLFAVGLFMGGTTWPLAVKALGLGLASTALTPKIKLPETNAATGGRLNKSIDPEANLKIIFGQTALGTDLRYWEVWGNDQSRIDEVIAAAGHKIQSYGAFYIDNELVTFSGNNATGKYAGALTRITSVEGQSGTVIATLGAGGRWNVSGGEAASMTGVAHYALRWTWTQEKLPRGIPTRITQVGEGALVYDPRRDSTRGGSGSHRADDQSTWQYTPTDSNGVPIGRNPALQMLWYLIGWRVENPYTGEMVLRCGQGVPLDDIDFAAFITAANDCEELEYYSDCILSTGDAHQTNIAVLESACAGVLSDVGGFYSLRIQKDDLDGTLVAFDDGDIVGDVDWQPRDALARRYNQVEGQYVDPDSLYQRRSYPLVRDAAYETADGFKRRTAANYDAVQDPDQAQRLARLQLNQSRVPGVFQAPFNWKAITVKPGQPIKLTLSRLGFSEKLFRVNSRKIDPGGAIWLALDEEDPAAYTPGTVLPQPPPEAGAGYDPGSVPTPSGDDWTATGGVIGTPGGVTQPGIAVDAAPLPAGITGVWIEYRRGTSGPWSEHYQGPPESADYTLSGLAAGATDYYVSIRYANPFRVWGSDDDRLIIGPLTVGGLTSGDTLAVGGRAASQVLAEIDEALEDAQTALADADQVARDLRRELDIEFSLLISGIARIEDQSSRDGTDSYRRLERVRVTSEGAQATADSILNLTASPSSALITKLDLFEAQFAGTDPSGLLTNINTRATITQLNQAVADIFGASVSSFTNIAAEFSAVDARLDAAETDILARATISQLNQVEAKADVANARAIQRLESSLAEAVGIFLSSIETTAREDEASARIVQRVSAQTDQNTAAAQLFLSAYTDGAGNALAVGGITLDVNGRITGFRLFSNGNTGEADFAVDKIKVNGITLFSAAGGGLLTSDTIRARLLEAVSDGDDAIAIEPGKPWLLWAGDKAIAAGGRTIANARTALTDDGGLYLGQQKYERTTTQNVDQTGSNWRVIARLDLTGVKENAVFSFAGTRLVFVNPPLSGSPADGNYQYTIRAHIQNRTFEDYAIGSVQTPPSTADSSFLAEGDAVAAVFSGDQTIIDNFQTQIARSGVRQLFLGTDTNTVYIYAQRSGTPHTETLRVASGTRIVAAPIINQDIF